MHQAARSEWLARLSLSLAALLPYLPLLSFRNIFITDDRFTSDIYNGELPGRVLIGELLKQGQAPVWTSQLCSGYPLGAGGVGEPLSLLYFWSLPVTPALAALVITMILVAAHGTYGLTRSLGANRVGAVLAGIAYAGSGYLATQLKHLAIVATVVWLPFGLLCLERSLAATSTSQTEGSLEGRIPPTPWQRFGYLGLFGMVWAEQVLAGFPQSAYFSALVYACWSLGLWARWLKGNGQWKRGLGLGLLLVLATLLGTLGGAIVYLPLAELVGVSDPRESFGWSFAAMLPYSPSDALSFILPYINGDVSDDTYRGQGLFWENYAYVGLATFVLAFFALIRGFRRPRMILLWSIGIVAFLLVLGPNTPVYYYFWKYFPGMGGFRFPTRFLFVVDLVLAVSGGLGLTWLSGDLERWLSRHAPSAAAWITLAICGGTALDLFAVQLRQNPFVPAEVWLAPPRSLKWVPANPRTTRTFAPWHDYFHRVANVAARGWTFLQPYYDLRDTLAPNIGAYWQVPSGDCYAGMVPRWTADVWGGHMRPGFLISYLTRMEGGRFVAAESLGRVLAAYGVTHVLTPLELQHPDLKPVGYTPSTAVYRVRGERVRVVPLARVVGDNREAARLLNSPRFDATKVVLLHDPPKGLRNLVAKSPGHTESSAEEFWDVDRAPPSVPPPPMARIVIETSERVRVEVTAPQGGYLLLADTFYPGWTARVDDKPATLLRANISVRAVPLPKGARVVEFDYRPKAFYRGLGLSSLAWALLGLWVLGARYWPGLASRKRSQTSTIPPNPEQPSASAK